MYGLIADDTKEIKYVLDNLCNETVSELEIIFGDGYKTKTYNLIKTLSERLTAPNFQK